MVVNGGMQNVQGGSYGWNDEEGSDGEDDMIM